MSRWSKNAWIKAYWSVTAIIVLTISGQALIGHLTGVAHFYQWRNGPSQVGMALNTAICLALLGSAVGVGLFWKDDA